MQIEALLSGFGLPAIFLTMALESALIPIPSEIVVPFGGFLASKGYFSLLDLVLVTSMANLIGSVIAYNLGTRMNWIHKFGFLEGHLKASQKLFDNHGRKTVFFARMLPAVRTFISLPAGLAKVPQLEFAILSFLGSLPWNFALGYAGYFLGKNWGLVHTYGKYFTIFVVVALPFAYYYWRRSSKK